MAHYRYVIVGGGMTADAAVKAIREIDSQSSVGLISAESNPPYDRPPLTKDLWQSQSLEDIWRGTEELEVGLHLGREVTELDPERKRVIDDQETIYTFDKLLLATGKVRNSFLLGIIASYTFALSMTIVTFES